MFSLFNNIKLLCNLLLNFCYITAVPAKFLYFRNCILNICSISSNVSCDFLYLCLNFLSFFISISLIFIYIICIVFYFFIRLSGLILRERYHAQKAFNDVNSCFSFLFIISF